MNILTWCNVVATPENWHNCFRCLQLTIFLMVLQHNLSNVVQWLLSNVCFHVYNRFWHRHVKNGCWHWNNLLFWSLLTLFSTSENTYNNASFWRLPPGVFQMLLDRCFHGVVHLVPLVPAHWLVTAHWWFVTAHWLVTAHCTWKTVHLGMTSSAPIWVCLVIIYSACAWNY